MTPVTRSILVGALAAALNFSPALSQTQPAGIAPSAAGKSLSVSNSSSCVAMTQQNTTFVVWNVGSVAAYFNMNGATATTGNPQLPAASAITVSAAPGAMLCAITASSTTTLQITQGSGFPAIAGSAGASGSTSDATAANQVLQIAQETAFNTALGLMADAACATDNGTCDVIALIKRTNQRLTTINTTLGTPMQATGGTVGLVAGVAEIGNVKNSGTFATQSAVTAASGSFASGAFASGSFASGSHASGSFASGAFASGSVASGALASGSIASGAMVDLVALSAPVAPATATATKSILLGAQATTGAVNPTNGQQSALSSDSNNNVLTSSGGAPNLAISQVSVATSDTAVVAARALRRAVTIQQITGTQNVFCNQTTATAANGVVLPAVVGASITFNTTSAVRCIAITGAQTVAVAETY